MPANVILFGKRVFLNTMKDTKSILGSLLGPYIQDTCPPKRQKEDAEPENERWGPWQRLGNVAKEGSPPTWYLQMEQSSATTLILDFRPSEL